MDGRLNSTRISGRYCRRIMDRRASIQALIAHVRVHQLTKGRWNPSLIDYQRGRNPVVSRSMSLSKLMATCCSSAGEVVNQDQLSWKHDHWIVQGVAYYTIIYRTYSKGRLLGTLKPLLISMMDFKLRVTLTGCFSVCVGRSLVKGNNTVIGQSSSLTDRVFLYSHPGLVPSSQNGLAKGNFNRTEAHRSHFVQKVSRHQPFTMRASPSYYAPKQSMVISAMLIKFHRSLTFAVYTPDDISWE